MHLKTDLHKCAPPNREVTCVEKRHLMMHLQLPASGLKFLTTAGPCGHSLSWILYPADSTWNGLWSIWWLDAPAAPASTVSPSGLVFLLTPATGLFSSPSPYCHIPLIPLPEASVCLLKDTLKFSCICHRCYLFLMTFLHHLHSPFTASPGSENTATIWRPVQPYSLELFGLKGGSLGTVNPLNVRFLPAPVL